MRLASLWFLGHLQTDGYISLCHRHAPKENSVVRLSPAKAFRQLYPQMTINQWNPEFIQAAINGIENLILQVPVWQLTCDMTEDAVKCLEAAIFPDTTIKMR